MRKWAFAAAVLWVKKDMDLMLFLKTSLWIFRLQGGCHVAIALTGWYFTN